MSKVLQRRLLKGFAANGFAQGINLIIQVVSVPIFLHYWGKLVYGEWLLLSSVLSYLSMSDLSFGCIAQNEMGMRVARGDKESALSVFQSCWLMVTIISVTVMLVALLVVPLMPFEVWLHLKQMSHGQTVAVLNLLILQVILAQQGGMLVAGFFCDGNYARGVICNNILRLTEFIISAFVVAWHGGLWGVALSVLLTRIVGYGVIYRILRWCSPWLSIGRRYASFDVVKPLIKPALSFNAFPLGLALSMQGILTVIGVILGPATVPLFSTTRTLTRFVIQPLGAITNSVWPELSRAFGERDIALARSLHRRACQIAFWFTSCAVSILMVVGQPLYHLWTHGKIPFNPGLFHMMLLVVFCSSLYTTSYAVPMSINRHSRIAVLSIIVISFSVALAVFLMQRWGIIGAAASLLIAEIVMLVYVVQHSLTLLHDDLRDFLRVVLSPPIGWLWAKLAPARAGAR